MDHLEKFGSWLLDVLGAVANFVVWISFAAMIIKTITALQGEFSTGDGRASKPIGTGSGRVISNLPDAVTLTGSPVVIDGDTLRIDDELIELTGIDAPELGQPCVSATTVSSDRSDGKSQTFDCGLAAKSALEKIIEEGDGKIPPLGQRLDCPRPSGPCGLRLALASAHPCRPHLSQDR